MKYIYLLAIKLYGFALFLASYFSSKARLWVDGRRGWYKRMPLPKKANRYWFHCASLGEFEQARPLIEHYFKLGNEVMITFFSPSGYVVRKNFASASWVGYLPLDTPRNATSFVQLMDADYVFFVKYEFWYFFLREIARSKVPFYLISARFREEQPFFQFYGKLHREMLTFYSAIFTQDKASADLLKTLAVSEVIVSGDTRFDRALQISESKQEFPLIHQFVGDAPTLIAGSCWPSEEELISQIMEFFPEWKWILVPHDISQERVENIKLLFPQALLYTDLEQGKKGPDGQVLIVNKMGMLSSIYPLGNAAIIGGGFHNALHNIIEASVWGIPIFYGDKVSKYPEAASLQDFGGGVMIKDAGEFVMLFKSLCSNNFLDEKGMRAALWVKENSGAVDKVLSYINLNEG